MAAICTFHATHPVRTQDTKHTKVNIRIYVLIDFIISNLDAVTSGMCGGRKPQDAGHPNRAVILCSFYGQGDS